MFARQYIYTRRKQLQWAYFGSPVKPIQNRWMLTCRLGLAGMALTRINPRTLHTKREPKSSNYLSCDRGPFFFTPPYFYKTSAAEEQLGEPRERRVDTTTQDKNGAADERRVQTATLGTERRAAGEGKQTFILLYFLRNGL